MTEFSPPVIAWAGSPNSSAPLVVLLHGRGATERDVLPLANALSPRLSVAAVRAPIAEGSGYAWFENRGIGRPLPDSLQATMAWFRDWLDQECRSDRPVLLVGFSGGAAFAGGLLLGDPSRFAGAAILYGTLPFDVGLPTLPGRLAGVPVFVAQGTEDHVIPRDLLDRTWSYLLTESAAPVIARRENGGHELTDGVVRALGQWIGERLAFVQDERRSTADDERKPHWHALGGSLPQRVGPSPDVSFEIPQQQISQNCSREMQEAVYEVGIGLSGVTGGPSEISVPGARAFMLQPPDGGPANKEAFIVPSVGEFAHLHPSTDGSLHLTLPIGLSYDLAINGWGRPHPLAGVRLSPGMSMVFGPRDEDELQIVSRVLETSHAYAVAGISTDPTA